MILSRIYIITFLRKFLVTPHHDFGRFFSSILITATPQETPQSIENLKFLGFSITRTLEELEPPNGPPHATPMALDRIYIITFSEKFVCNTTSRFGGFPSSILLTATPPKSSQSIENLKCLGFYSQDSLKPCENLYF